MGFTRQNAIGLAGKPVSGAAVQPGENDQRSPEGVSDPFLKQYVVEIPLVASAAEQALPFTMPAAAVSMAGFLRVKRASTAGTTPSVNVGIVGDPDALLALGATNAIATLPISSEVDLSGRTLAYSFASADIVGFEGELVLTVCASDE